MYTLNHSTSCGKQSRDRQIARIFVHKHIHTHAHMHAHGRTYVHTHNVLIQSTNCKMDIKERWRNGLDIVHNIFHCFVNLKPQKKVGYIAVTFWIII